MTQLNTCSRLAELAGQIQRCTQCALHTSRTHAVPGDGKPSARLMFIGEAPGREEDARGHPFVGAAGQTLDRLLSQHGIDRQDVFITNIVKCRPENNRNPKKAEIETCTSHYLFEQIDLIDPQIIVVLGRVAAKTLLGVQRLNEARGHPIQRDSRIYVVAYHPAATFYRDDIAAKLEEDFATLARALEQ